jgi:hypothetical protein
LSSEYYLARPYNFNLSPLFFLDNRIKDRFPERKIVFSSSAADFLQGEGFDFGKVFSQGVFYLSHAEEEETRARFRIRNERENGKSDVVIPPGDAKALEFYRNARKTIAAWVNAEKVLPLLRGIWYEALADSIVFLSQSTTLSTLAIRMVT